MTRKVMTIILGIALASGLAFCKQEEVVKVEEKVETIGDTAKAPVGEMEKKVTEATKAVETEVKKKTAEGINTAKEALSAKLPK